MFDIAPVVFSVIVIVLVIVHVLDVDFVSMSVIVLVFVSVMCCGMWLVLFWDFCSLFCFGYGCL